MKSQRRLRIDEIRRQQYIYHSKIKYPDYYDSNSPYTWFKARFYIEGAVPLVWLLQGVHPNIITYLYGLLGLLGGILLALSGILALPNKAFTLIAVFIFFTKGILDGVDGHLARIQNKESEFGKRLDALCGKIGTISFYYGLSFWVWGVLIL